MVGVTGGRSLRRRDEFVSKESKELIGTEG